MLLLGSVKIQSLINEKETEIERARERARERALIQQSLVNMHVKAAPGCQENPAQNMVQMAHLWDEF